MGPAEGGACINDAGSSAAWNWDGAWLPLSRDVANIPKRYFRQPEPGRWRCRAAAGACVAAAGGLVLHATVRDRFVGLATWYYATPAPVCVLLFLMALLAGIRYRRRWLALLAGLGALAAGGWWVCGRLPATRAPSMPAADSPQLRVMEWNMAGGAFGLEHVERVIRDSNADLIGLVEARPPGEWMDNWWAVRFPEYEAVATPERLMLLSRLPLQEVREGRFSGMGRFLTAKVAWHGDALTVFVVDIQHYVQRSRGPALSAMRAELVARRGERLIVLGDFNTPPGSVHFDALRSEFWSVTELGRSAALPTWPVPLPVLALDQIWVSREVAVGRVELGWTWWSDHRPVLAEVTARSR